MKGMIQKVLFFTLFIGALYSCSSLGRIGIQVPVPPKYPVSSEIQSLTLLDRSLTPEFTNLDRDSLEKILVNHELDLDTIFHDSIAADTAIQVAAKALYESGRFDAVVPDERNVVREDTGGVLPPLDKEFIESIRKRFNTDGVLVLEDFSEHLTTDFSTSRFNSIYEFGRPLVEYSGIINIYYKSVWRLYQPQLDPPIVRYEANDSIFWESADYTLREMYNKLPSIKEALIGGGIAAARQIAGDISPGWENEDRKYYITGNKNIDAAIPLLKENKWDQAAEIWMKYLSSSSKTVRSQIQFNLALASEMTGHISLAIDWATKSYATKPSRIAEQYIKYLKEREAALQKTTGG